MTMIQTVSMLLFDPCCDEHDPHDHTTQDDIIRHRLNDLKANHSEPHYLTNGGHLSFDEAEHLFDSLFLMPEGRSQSLD